MFQLIMTSLKNTVFIILLGQFFCPVILIRYCGSPQMFRRDSGNSTQVAFGDFPWMLALIHTEKYVFCGASLIHPKVAVTSATCVRLYRAYEKEGANPVVRAGELHLNKENEELPHQNRKIEKSILHPDYVEKGSEDQKVSLYALPTQAHDVALIILEKEFEFVDDKIDKICLDHQGTKTGDKCIITGWGKTDNNKTPPLPYMQRLELNVESDALCADRIKNLTKFKESFLCTKTPEKTLDTCAGFNGGPVICQRDEREEYVLSGIFTTRVYCGTDMPSLTSNVFFYYDWIKAKLKENDISLYYGFHDSDF